MSSDNNDRVVDVVVTAESDRYDDGDERWLTQVADLRADLRREVVGFRVEPTRTTGTKGAVEAMILSLGSAGAFTAAVQCLRAWLARDKSRRVVITWTHDGHEERVAFEGDAVDAGSLQRLVQVAGEHLGDEP